MAECTYLGHVIGDGHVKPEINKPEVVENFPVIEGGSIIPWQGTIDISLKILLPLLYHSRTNLTRKKHPETDNVIM